MAIDDLNPGTVQPASGPGRCRRCGSADCAQILDPDAASTTADDDAYPFVSRAIGEPTLDNCRACNGTGEISEFPADDDERLVACPTCGGTGEVWE